jgi:transcriptional regulator with GAF, ATPase, and Fis domain
MSLDRPLTETLDEFERAVIVRALSSAGGNVAEAARRLKTDRPNLYRRMKRLGVAEGTHGSGTAGGAGNRNG